MNTYDIDQALRTLRPADANLVGHTNAALLAVRRKAVLFLAAFRDEVDANSDGWSHWAAPVKAANKLMQIVQGNVVPTEANYKAAMAQIKSFYTRKGNAAGMRMPVIF